MHSKEKLINVNVSGSSRVSICSVRWVSGCISKSAIHAGRSVCYISTSPSQGGLQAHHDCPRSLHLSAESSIHQVRFSFGLVKFLIIWNMAIIVF